MALTGFLPDIDTTRIFYQGRAIANNPSITLTMRRRTT